MKRLVRYAASLLAVLAGAATYVALNSVAYRNAALIAALGAITLYVLWDARFGQLKQTLPGARSIDFIAFAALMIFTTAMIAIAETVNMYAFLGILGLAWTVWGGFALYSLGIVQRQKTALTATRRT